MTEEAKAIGVAWKHFKATGDDVPLRAARAALHARICAEARVREQRGLSRMFRLNERKAVRVDYPRAEWDRGEAWADLIAKEAHGHNMGMGMGRALRGVGTVIRFVDLRGQDTGSRFAFFDTVSDTFIDERGLGPVWDTWQEFEQAYGIVFEASLIERLRGLAPDWTRTPENESREIQHCILCEVTDPDHAGDCKTRDQLVAWLAGTP